MCLKFQIHNVTMGDSASSIVVLKKLASTLFPLYDSWGFMSISSSQIISRRWLLIAVILLFSAATLVFHATGTGHETDKEANCVFVSTNVKVRHLNPISYVS